MNEEVQNEEATKKAKRYSDLQKRVRTAFFLGLVILGSLFLHTIAFLLVFGVFFYLLSLEFFNLRDGFHLVEKRSRRLNHGLAILSIIPYALSLFFYTAEVIPGLYPGTMVLFALLASAISITDMYGYSYSRMYRLPAWVTSVFFLGTHYSMLPLIFFMLPNPLWFLALLFTIWGSDSMAYFLGKKFGRKKLYFTLSPRKTIEGLLGGFAGGVLMMAVFSLWLPIEIFPAVVGGFLIAVGVSLGDLVESRFKRLAHVKDSGVILPGHGGMYDRFDGLLFILPYVFLTLVYLMQI